MERYGYSDRKEKESAKRHSENNIIENNVPKNSAYYSIKPIYQDYHIPYRNNVNLSENTNVVQCFAEESRTLSAEAQAIRDAAGRRANSLKLEMADFDISGQFDDDYYDMCVTSQILPILHETMHHILPRSSIDQFIDNLDKKQKQQVLLTFLRYTKGDKSDVTEEEYNRIKEGRDDVLVEHMLERTLKSLRSNLEFGPTVRSDDPGAGLDPNFVPGEGEKIDEISSCYQAAYAKIEELKVIKVENERRRSVLTGEIVELLKKAESILASQQGISGEDA